MMFHNELTRKMPCWNCAKYDPRNDKECPILNAFLDSMPTMMKEPGRSAISNLTFSCSELRYREVEERFINALKGTGLFRAALIYQEERFRLLFKPEAYDKDGKLVPEIRKVWDDFNLLGRIHQVIVIDHTDSERDFRKEQEREREPGLIIHTIVHDEDYRGI